MALLPLPLLPSACAALLLEQAGQPARSSAERACHLARVRGGAGTNPWAAAGGHMVTKSGSWPTCALQLQICGKIGSNALTALQLLVNHTMLL